MAGAVLMVLGAVAFVIAGVWRARFLATVLLYAGFGTAGWAITLMITALATLASALNFCVGCEMYMLLARVRGVAIDRHPAR